MNIYNQSHCADPTPKMAVDSIKRDQKDEVQKHRAKELLWCILRICNLAGFDLVSLSIRSRATGTTYTKGEQRGNPKKKE